MQETHLHPHDFIVPLFVVEGKSVKEEIPSMPDIYRMSLDEIQKEVGLLWKMGLKGVLVFVKVEDRLKDNAGTEAFNANGLMQRAIQSIKATVPEMVVFSDVALDPYSSFGHDGIVEKIPSSMTQPLTYWRKWHSAMRKQEPMLWRQAI